MATRVNTKFVVILATALVLLVGGSIFAFTKYMKSASDYARMGEDSLLEAQDARKAGDIELSNAKLDRASRYFGTANQKDAKNTSYLYRLIDAQELVACDDLTLAYNHVETIRGAAASIHDTPGATEEDRAYLYELLHKHDRMDLVINGRPARGFINFYANNWLNNHPGDAMAMRYLAIGETGFVESEQVNSEKRRKILENLTSALEADPKNPWLYNAAGRYHIGNARRLYRASGSAFTDEVNATFYRSYEELKRAVALADQNKNPGALVEALGLMLEISSRDQTVATEIIGERIETARLLHEKLADKAVRDKLFTQELAKAVRYIGLMGSGIEGHAFEGFEYSQKLAEAVVKDRADEPAAYAILGALYSERSKLEESEKTIENGLKTLSKNRLPNPVQFVEDVQARLNMLSTIAEVKINLAQQIKDDREAKKALLVEAGKLVAQLAKAPAPQTEQRDARSQFLRGRIDFA